MMTKKKLEILPDGNLSYLANLSSEFLSDSFSADLPQDFGTLPLAEALPIFSRSTRAWFSSERRREWMLWVWSGRGPRSETRQG